MQQPEPIFLFLNLDPRLKRNVQAGEFVDIVMSYDRNDQGELTTVRLMLMDEICEAPGLTDPEYRINPAVFVGTVT